MVKSAQKGFTLVELMVTISIIAILTTIGLVVYTGVQAGARDAKRKGDMDAFSSAYETNYDAFNTTGRYRALVATDFSGGAVPVDQINGSRGGFNYQYQGMLTAASNT